MMRTKLLLFLFAVLASAAWAVPTSTIQYPNNTSISYHTWMNFSLLGTDANNSTLNATLYINGAVNATNESLANNTAWVLNQTLGFGAWNATLQVCDVNATPSCKNSSQVSFTLTNPVMQAPWANGTSFDSEGSVYLSYYVWATAPSLQCQLYLNGALADNVTMNSSNSTPGTSRTIKQTATATNTWYVSCYVVASPSTVVTSPTYSFSKVSPAYTSSYALGTDDPNVYSTPQGVYYDVNGNLTTIYNANNNGTDQLRIQTIGGYNYSLNGYRTTDFMAVLRLAAADGLLTFERATNTTEQWFQFAGGTITPTNVSSTFNVNLSNSYYDPYAYAYTKHYSSLSLDGSSYYLLYIPNGSTSTLTKINAPPTLVPVATTHAPVVWQTIAGDSALHSWYYAKTQDCGGSTYNITIYSYDGTTETLVATPDPTCYTPAQITSSKVAFEEFNGTKYFFQFNTSNTTIYQIGTGKYYTFNNAVTSPSYFLFYSNESFAFFDGAYEYACYFGQFANCTRINMADYGLSVSFEKGWRTTSKRSGLTDTVTSGQVVGPAPDFYYQTRVYDAKYACYDEQFVYQKPLNLRSYASSATVVMTSGVYTYQYVANSSQFGTGQRRLYTLCTNGTTRQYFTTSDQYNLISLNSTLGSYYTFNVKDCLSNQLNGVTITAKRQISQFGGWTTVEQALTELSGAGTLFLETGIPYNLTFEISGRPSVNTGFSPNPTNTTLTVYMDCVTGNVSMDTTEHSALTDLQYYVSPATGYRTNKSQFNISYVSYSPSGRIVSSNLIIWRTPTATANVTNYSRVVIYNATSTSRFGFNVTYMVNTTQPAIYEYTGTIVAVRDDINNSAGTLTLSNYNTNVIVVKGSAQVTSFASLFQQIKETLDRGTAFGGWAWVFVATIITMLAMGYISRYTIDGAGLIGAAIFTFFALLHNAEIVIPGWGTISMIMISALSFIMVILILAMKHL